MTKTELAKYKYFQKKLKKEKDEEELKIAKDDAYKTRKKIIGR